MQRTQEPDQGQGSRPTRSKRWKAILWIVGGCMVAILGMLVYDMIIKGDEYAAQAYDNQLRPIDNEAFRGTILDRNGNILAQSIEMRQVVADPTELKAGKVPPEEAALQLHQVLGGDVMEYTEKLSRDGKYVLLEKCIDLDTAARVEALDLPGVYTVFTTQREYPYGGVGAQILGGVNGEGVGNGGLEYYYNDLLAPSTKVEYVEYGLKGIPFIGGTVANVSQEKGGNLVCTIDIEMQAWIEDFAQRTMEERQAEKVSIMVLDADTGEIYATCSTPLCPREGGWREATPDEQTLATVASAYDPGSMFKPIVATAAIDSGAMTEDKYFTIPPSLKVYDRTITDSHPHGTLEYTLSQIIEHSSNIGTVLVARTIGDETVAMYATRFGFGQDAGTDFGYVSDGLLKDYTEWAPVDSANIPFGQGMTCSVLQIARAYAVFANGGTLVTPHFMLLNTKVDGPYDWPSDRIISIDTAERLQLVLRRVVTRGTASLAAVGDYPVAGKTGTAQYAEEGSGGYYSDRYIYGFAGFIVGGDPNFVVVITIKNPQRGAETATPDFSEVMTYVTERYYVKVTD